MQHNEEMGVVAFYGFCPRLSAALSEEEEALSSSALSGSSSWILRVLMTEATVEGWVGCCRNVSGGLLLAQARCSSTVGPGGSRPSASLLLCMLMPGGAGLLQESPL